MQKEKCLVTSVRVVRWTGNKVSSQLMGSEIDLAIGVQKLNHPNIMQKSLYEDGYNCAVRKGPPILKGKQNIERFLQYPRLAP